MQEHFIARQPIVTKNGEIIGYELLFRSKESQQRANFDSDAIAGMSVLNNFLGNFGQDWLLGGKTAFINAAEEMLQSEFVSLLSPNKTVFEITPSTKVSPKLVELVNELRGDGFSFAFDDCALMPEMAPLLPACSYVKIDVQRTGMLGLLAEIKKIKMIPALTKAKIICCKIESQQEKGVATESGADFYQGYFFEKPQLMKAKRLAPNAAALLQAINLSRREASPAQVEDALKKDVASSLKLLRYINSAGFGLRVEVTSYRHAVQLLGYQKLTRWLLLLLATSNKDAPPALATSAIARGRFMELLGTKTMSKEAGDALFLTGAFSLLDALLGVDLGSVIPDLGLPEETRAALLDMEGSHYPFLMLAIAMERGLAEMATEQTEMLGLTSREVNQALMEATAWATSFCG